MKKSRVLACMMVIALNLFMRNSVMAADITIGKYKYPSVIIIPIASIIISFLILLFLVVRIIRRREGALIEDITYKLKSELKKTKKTKKIEKEDIKKEKNYLNEIRRFKRHLPNLESDRAFEILSGITKNFFKELLGLNYEFTYNELANELKSRSKRKELIDVCQRVSDLKYSDEKISKDELMEITQEFEAVLKRERIKKEEKELGISRALQHKKGFFRNLAYIIKASKEVSTESERKRKIIELIKEEQGALQQDMDIAKDIYHKILASYYKLPPKEKKEVYESLNKFYNEINSMLFSSFYSEKSKKQLEYFAERLAQMKEETEKTAKEKELQEKKEENVREKLRAIAGGKREEMEDLKKLEELEKAAKERIKLIGESILKHAIDREFNKPRQEIRKSITPTLKPVTKQEIKHGITRRPESADNTASVHSHLKKMEALKFVEKTAKERLPVKKKKLQALDRESEEIKAKLERLENKNYI